MITKQKIHNVLSSLYTKYDNTNLAAYEIILKLDNKGNVLLSWDNYDYGHRATETIVDNADPAHCLIG